MSINEEFFPFFFFLSFRQILINDFILFLKENLDFGWTRWFFSLSDYSCNHFQKDHVFPIFYRQPQAPCLQLHFVWIWSCRGFFLVPFFHLSWRISDLYSSKEELTIIGYTRTISQNWLHHAVTDAKPEGQMQGSSTSSLTPGCSCTALSSTGMTECPSGHSLPSIVITYIPFSFLSSSNCCTRNTISTLVFSVSTFQHICFEFGFSHPVAVCGLPPAEWHHDQYPPVSVSQFLCIEIIG